MSFRAEPRNLCHGSIVYLIEKTKLGADALDRVDQALDDPNPMVMVAPLERGVVISMQAIERSIVPDLPDHVTAARRTPFGSL